MRFAMVLVVAALAQVVPTEAERTFADQLIALADEQAHAAIASAGPDRITEGLAAALNNAGVSIYNRHDTTGSLRVYRLAIDAAERGGFKILEAKARANVSIDLTRMGELEDALQEVNRAVDLYRGANVPSSFANILSTRAVTYKDLGEFDQAREDYAQAEQMFRQVGDEVGLARVLNGEGQLLLDSGDYRGALSALEKSLALAQRHDQNLGEAFVLNNMAAVYSAEGNFTLAISFASRSLKLKQALGSKEDTGTSLISLGVIYHKGGRDNEAIASFESAAQIGRESGRKTVTAEALRELGTLELHRKRYAASLEYLESCLQLYKESGSAVYEERALARIAQVYLLQGDYSRAAEVAERSLALARDHDATPDLFIPGVVAGKAYRALGRNGEARAALEDAVAAAEEGRDRVAGDEQSRQKFFAERLEPYRDLIALDLADGQTEAAFRMSERAKSRVLLDLVAPGRTGVDRILTAPERTKEADLHRRLSLARAQLATLVKNPGGADRVRMTKVKIDGAQRELANFRSVLYTAHPELSARRGDVSPVTLAQAAELLPDSASAILDYEVTAESAYLFVITKSSGGPAIQVHKLTLDGPRLQVLATEFRAKLASRDPGFAAVAERLYRALLSPARAELAGKKLLIVAPDADLWQIPLAALRSPAGRYLIEDAAVVYTPSLSVLHTLRAVKRAPANGKPTFAAFGDPDGDNPNANREVKTLAELYGATSTWIGSQASVPNFRARAGSFEVVHVAAHGVFDDEDPLRSHVILHKESGALDEGHLEAADIQDLQLKARLVVLSGCETARGRFAEGEGAIGMSWAFLAAGSRAVVASQWRVESTSTTELMLQFHKNLLGGQGDAQALRQAALELMKAERFRHPFYWAGFAVFGDGY